MERNTAAARNADMLNYDFRIGPLTRQVIQDSPNELVVGMMLAQSPMECINPNTGEFYDDKLATWLQGEISKRYGRPAEYFQVRPIKGRHARH